MTVDLPSLSLVVDVADREPPPDCVQVSDTPATGLVAASSTCTTSAESSADDKSPDWPPPETILMMAGGVRNGRLFFAARKKQRGGERGGEGVANGHSAHQGKGVLLESNGWSGDHHSNNQRAEREVHSP